MTGGIVIGRAPAVRPTIDASTVRGLHGRLTWHDYPAADIHVYTVTRSGLVRGVRTWTLSGHVSNVNPFTLAQRPLTFVAPHRLGKWYWPVVELHVEHGACAASLGAPIMPDTVRQTAQVQRLVQQQQQRPLATNTLQRLLQQQRQVR